MTTICVRFLTRETVLESNSDKAFNTFNRIVIQGAVFKGGGFRDQPPRNFLT